MKVSIAYSSWEKANTSLGNSGLYVTPHSFMSAYNIVGYQDNDTGFVLEFVDEVSASWFLLRFA